jgi:2-hydroxy-6-oxonona-2,4-dienedioate hydrolase
MFHTRRDTIDVLGVPISFLAAGAGPRTVLLLHGITSDATNWAATLPALAAAGFRAIAPDQLGFGRSHKPNVPISPQTLADMVGPLLGALGIERAHVVGQSMGGHVAGLFAIEHPQRVDSLVLVNAGYALALPEVGDPALLGHAERPGGLWAVNPVTRKQARALLEAVFFDKRRFVTEEAVDAFFGQRLATMDGLAISSIQRSWARREYPLDSRLGELGGIRTLVVQSDRDEITPLHLGRKLAAGIPNATLSIVDDCGHAPPLEAPDRFNELLLGFLGGPGPDGARKP